MALGGEKVAKGKLTHLRRSGLDQLFVAVAKRRAPQPRHPFDIGPALGVVDEHALSALDDQRTGFAQRREIGVGVNQGLEVADGEIAERGHDLASSLQRYGRRSELASKASVSRHLTGGCLLHCLSKIPQDAETHARGAQNPRQAAADPAGLYQFLVMARQPDAAVARARLPRRVRARPTGTYGGRRGARPGLGERDSRDNRRSRDPARW